MSSFLSSWEVDKRLQFAASNSENNWKNVIFSDVTTFSIHKAGHVFRGTRPCISVNKTKVSVRIWAWFSSDGGGSIALLNNLSEKQFLELVEEELIPQAVTRFGNGPVRFINDGESRVSFNTFNQFPTLISFKQLKWPAKSNHLSPFVTIWSLIERSIQLQRRQPRNADELWEYVNIMWERRTGQPLFWEGLIINLQAKLRSIVTAGGEMTDIEKK